MCSSMFSFFLSFKNQNHQATLASMSHQIQMLTASFQDVLVLDKDPCDKCEHSPCLSDDGETKRTVDSTITGMESCSLDGVPLELWSSDWSSFDDSVSSMSSDESSHWSQPEVATRRRLFPNMLPSAPVREVSDHCPKKDDEAVNDGDDISQGSSSSNTYERTLRQQEGVLKPPVFEHIIVNTKPRWSLFARCMSGASNTWWCYTPRQDLLLVASGTIEHDNSNSSLPVVQTSKSCLIRRSKYTGVGRKPQTRRHSRSVSFDYSVSVFEYEAQRAAPPGWSTYFF